VETFDALVVISASGIRLAVPLIFACLAGLWSERSGIVDIGLEGKMLTGAFAAAAVALLSGSAWAGLGAGIVASIGVSLIHGYASIDQRANQIVSGTAINMVADGMTALIGNAIWSQGGRTPQLPDSALFNPIRARRPTRGAGDAASLEQTIAHELAEHDIFHDPEHTTTADIFGRIRGH